MIPILEIQNNILKKIEELFKNEKFITPSKEERELTYHKGFLPFYNFIDKYKNGKEEESSIPFILLKYKEDSQTLSNGKYDAEAVWEIIIGTFMEYSNGYEIGLGIADKIKKCFMEYSNIPKKFQIRQDYIKTKLLDESAGFYWFHKIEFKTYIPYYDSKIPL